MGQSHGPKPFASGARGEQRPDARGSARGCQGGPSSSNSSQGAKPQPPANRTSRLQENPHFKQGQVTNAQNSQHGAEGPSDIAAQEKPE